MLKEKNFFPKGIDYNKFLVYDRLIINYYYEIDSLLYE